LDIAALGHNLLMQMQKMPIKHFYFNGARVYDSSSGVAYALLTHLNWACSILTGIPEGDFKVCCVKKFGTYKAELYQSTSFYVLGLSCSIP